MKFRSEWFITIYLWLNLYQLIPNCSNSLKIRSISLIIRWNPFTIRLSVQKLLFKNRRDSYESRSISLSFRWRLNFVQNPFIRGESSVEISFTNYLDIISIMCTQIWLNSFKFRSISLISVEIRSQSVYQSWNCCSKPVEIRTNIVQFR